ncbi:MAG: hypothetical protein ABGY41_12835, partial [Candidatus Poribacteria bacterium]
EGSGEGNLAALQAAVETLQESAAGGVVMLPAGTFPIGSNASDFDRGLSISLIDEAASKLKMEIESLPVASVEMAG